MSCRIVHGEANGWQALKLANSLIEVTVLPQKGADIFAFVDRASGLDVLMKTAGGLLPPGSSPKAGSHDDRFLHNYEGAWQELFPNTGPSCSYDGRAIPLHGEVASLPWTYRVERDDEQCVDVRLDVRCQLMPLALTRRMSLRASSPVLMLDERVQNLSNQTVSFVWGHHPVLGAPFLEAGCVMHAPDCVAHTPDPPFDPANASYAPGQRAAWPYIRTIDGGNVDLRAVPGPEANTHDHACLTDLKRGWVEVENPRLGLAFALEWDTNVFRWVNNWRPFGGSHVAPLDGIYGIALEPWAARGNLEQAITTRTALSLAPNASLSTSLRATLRSRPASNPTSDAAMKRQC